ncbi:MAG: DUF5683 domain-containing protein [Bacteroidota bacterium]
MKIENYFFRDYRSLFFLKPKFFLILFYFFFTHFLFAQTKTDSTIVISKNDSIIPKHSPTKATLLSLALPGAGQFYNKKYWKIPVIYGGIAAMGYLVRFNDKHYQNYKKAYILRLDGDTTSVDEYANIYSEPDLKTLKDFYRRNRDLSYIVAGLIYIMNILDADVDAHLFYFNVNDDLSFHLQPSVNYTARNKMQTGLSLTFNF